MTSSKVVLGNYQNCPRQSEAETTRGTFLGLTLHVVVMEKLKMSPRPG